MTEENMKANTRIGIAILSLGIEFLIATGVVMPVIDFGHLDVVYQVVFGVALLFIFKTTWSLIVGEKGKPPKTNQ